MYYIFKKKTHTRSVRGSREEGRKKGYRKEDEVGEREKEGGREGRTAGM